MGVSTGTPCCDCGGTPIYLDLHPFGLGELSGHLGHGVHSYNVDLDATPSASTVRRVGNTRFKVGHSLAWYESGVTLFYENKHVKAGLVAGGSYAEAAGIGTLLQRWVTLDISSRYLTPSSSSENDPVSHRSDFPFQLLPLFANHTKIDLKDLSVQTPRMYELDMYLYDDLSFRLGGSGHAWGAEFDHDHTPNVSSNLGCYVCFRAGNYLNIDDEYISRLQLLAITATGVHVLAAWEEPYPNDSYSGFGAITGWGPPLGMYDVTWGLVPGTVDSDLYRSYCRVEKGITSWEEYGTEELTLSEWMKCAWSRSGEEAYWLPDRQLTDTTSGACNGNSFNVRCIGGTHVDVEQMTVSHPYEETIEKTSFNLISEAPEWTSLNSNSFEWANPINYDDESDFNPSGQFVSDIGPYLMLDSKLHEIRNKGIRTRIEVEPFTTYRLDFLSHNDTHPFVLMIDRKVVFRSPFYFGGNHQVAYGNTAPELPNHVTPVGFYFQTDNETSVVIRFVGFTFFNSDYADDRFSSGKITDLKLHKLTDVPASTRVYEPYPYYYNGSDYSHEFSGWTFELGGDWSTKTHRIEIDSEKLPGTGPWTYSVVDGALPSGAALDSSSGEITFDGSNSAPIPSGIVAIKMVDSVSAKFRTRIYRWRCV